LAQRRAPNAVHSLASCRQMMMRRRLRTRSTRQLASRSLLLCQTISFLLCCSRFRAPLDARSPELLAPTFSAPQLLRRKELSTAGLHSREPLRPSMLPSWSSRAQVCRVVMPSSSGQDVPSESSFSALDTLQVVVYRLALVVAASAWFAVYSLDFFMTSGIDIIDGSVQASALSLFDLCAGVAALLAPTGSLVLAGAVLRAVGATALFGIALSATGAGSAGSLLGPACIILVFAREIYWFGIWYKSDCLVGILVFAGVFFLRLSALDQGMGDVLSSVDGGVAPVGPPVPLSFIGATSMFVSGVGKLFEPLGEDLDEEGEQWAKRSSTPLNGGDDEPPVVAAFSNFFEPLDEDLGEGEQLVKRSSRPLDGGDDQPPGSRAE